MIFSQQKLPLLLLLALLSLTGCSPFSSKLQPAELTQLPQSYSLYGETAAIPEQWWQSFAAGDLNRLIDEALSDNLSLRQAWARLKQAQSLSRQSSSERYPDLSLSADRSSSQQRSGGQSSDFENNAIGLSSNYELDLWGRVAANINSQQQQQQATREDLNAAATSLAAEISDRWLQLLGQRQQQELLSEQLQTAQSYLDLIELRFRKAQATALDLLQQKEALAALRTRLPALEAEEQRLRHELAVLLGNNPQQALQLTDYELPQLTPLPALGLPAELLQQRPDIRAAGLRLQAADWQLAAAKAERLPALRLTATASSDATNISDLFDNWLLNLASNLTAPLLDGGQRSAEVERHKALISEQLAAYQQTVLTAIREVEDALISEQKLLEQQTAIQTQLDLAEQALRTAKNRYQKGLNDYLPVLTELKNVEQLQQDLLNQQLNLLTNRVALHRALGGSWTEQLQAQQLEVQL